MKTKNQNHIAEIKISYSAKVKKQYRISIKDSQDSYNSFLHSWDKDLIELQEEFKVMLLNRANEVLGIHNLSKGTTNGVTVDIKLIFAIALKACATGIIVAHNHPSGNLKPSQTDLTLTRKIKKSADFLDISFVDHLIVTKEGYYSMADKGVI